MKITRRSLLLGAAAGAGTLLVPSRAAVAAQPAPQLTVPAGVRIFSITSSVHAVKHPRKIGRNSRMDHPAGHDEGLVRVRTSEGVEGFGNAFPEAALGKRLEELVEFRDGRLALTKVGRPMFRSDAEGTLLDVVAKTLKCPASQLLGKAVRAKVPCYDGSIYMRDLDGDMKLVEADAAAGAKAGHTAFKIKIGRGNWLKDRAKGYQQDLEAIAAVRAAAGKCTVLVDANNYYNISESLQLLKDMGETPFYWMEEMFEEEQGDDYRKLRQAIRDAKLPTLLADGESGRGEGALLDLLKEGTVQVSQPDIRTLGLFAFLEYADRLRPMGATVGPHTWHKQLGVLETCLLGTVVENFTMVEDVNVTSEVVKLPHLKISGGQMTLDAVPGTGIEIDEEAYARLCAPKARTAKA